MIPFVKYQGTGNDFVLVDDRQEKFDVANVDLISKMCDRRYGIGADGLMLIREHQDYDFEMVYFNSDGRQSSMCGNGGRCIVQYASDLGLVGADCAFLAIDGKHTARILDDGRVSLSMCDVDKISENGDDFVLDTGSPHYIQMVDAIPEDVVILGRAVRYSDDYAQEGINVNFVCRHSVDHISVATYERGVEDETLSCGTGVTAGVLACAHHAGAKTCSTKVDTKGGRLEVSAVYRDDKWQEVWLTGPANFVYRGVWSDRYEDVAGR